MYDKYIGIPYLENGRSNAGLDCWGLVRLFYKQEFNIDLPSYVDEYNGSKDSNLPNIVEYHKDNWTKTINPKLGDVCLFNMLGEPTHVGVYLGNSKFLHARDGQSTVIESTQRPIWRNRLEGIYSYTPKSNIIQLTGMPHPFRQNRVIEFAVAGITVKQCVELITDKYKISTKLVKQLIVLVDGIVIATDRWASTVLKAGQEVTYKTVPQGRNALRTLLLIAVVVISQGMALQVAGALFPSLTGATAAFAVAATKIALTAIGMALINALVPIRQPKVETPETGQQLSLFTGAANRGTPYGAIPVVLGRVQMTPPLGAEPYVDTQTTTSYMHLQLVWGFGPLRVDQDQFYVGANKIDYYYQNNLTDSVPRPVTVNGFVDKITGLETETETISRFNNMYPSLTQQIFKNVELENLTTSNTEIVTFTETQATKVQAIVSFPEGLRKISTKDGKSYASQVTIQAQLEKIDGGTTTTVSDWSSKATFNHIVLPTKVLTNDYDFDTGAYISQELYQKTVFCITPKDGIVAISGTPSQANGVNPNSTIVELLKKFSLASLVPSEINNTYLFEPSIPIGYKPLYSVVITTGFFSVNGEVARDVSSGIMNTVKSLSTPLTSPAFSHNGWVFNASLQTKSSYDSSGNYEGEVSTNNWSINISAGTLGSSTNNSINLQPLAGGAVPTRQTVWHTRQFSNILNTTNSRSWGAVTGTEKSFMNEYSVWYGTGTTFDQSATVNFPYEGIYTIQAAVDNEGEIIIGSTVIKIPTNSFSNAISLSSGNAPYETTIFLNSGTKTVRIKASNRESTSTTANSANAGVAVRILFVPDNVVNYVPGANYITIGDNEFINYKDGFNFPITWDNLVPGQYRISLTRTSTSDPDYQTDFRHSFKTQFLSATAFKNGVFIVPPNGIGICRTSIIVESSGKVNGQVDGVNAIVQTLGWDYIIPPGGSTKQWVPDQPINNPASLFVYVLTSKANAYHIPESSMWTQINKEEIEDWHNYCSTPVTNIRPILTYNGVVNNTSSVLDILKDICAAGMASPVFIDGKWSIVIDRAKPHVIQHFTPHNSWGFEATKNLPKVPDALRISFPDETNAYQLTEILVANFGSTVSTAKVIEELQLPGITKIEQARYFARWHLAQIYYRPEIFTINTDFEYLVCTRGDRVKVTHDIPMWGYGSGRIKSISANKLTITLTEQVYLEAGKSYQIRVRTDNLTSTVGSGSLERNIATITSTGYYTTLTLATAVDSTVKEDDLFMVGELNKVTQDLLVQSIQPSSNTSAQLTLVEYTESLYNFQFDPFNDSSPNLPSYVPTISKRLASETAKNTIATSPTILSVESRSEFSEQISAGTYQNTTIITWENSINLPVVAEKVELQIIRGSEQFNETKQNGQYLVNKESSSYIILGLEKDQVYKFRARYRNSSGSISGPWSDEYATTITGKNTNPFSPSDLQITLEGTNVVVKPTIATGVIVPADHKTYEFRLYRSSGSGDFWDTTWDSTNMLKAQSRTQAVFSLLDLPSSSGNRRISASGINYIIACRALNNTDNYSATSVLGSIKIKTIQ